VYRKQGELFGRSSRGENLYIAQFMRENEEEEFKKEPAIGYSFGMDTGTMELSIETTRSEEVEGKRKNMKGKRKEKMPAWSFEKKESLTYKKSG